MAHACGGGPRRRAAWRKAGSVRRHDLGVRRLALQAHRQHLGQRLAEVVQPARVALGDAAGAALKARAVVVVIGERPGLSSPDSLGLYVTFDPRAGRSDAERNCISNVRPAGLSFEFAAFKLNWLLTQAFARGLTGVNLKDESDRLIEAGTPDPAIGRG